MPFLQVEVLDNNITYYEIIKSIISMSNGKAPGPDGIVIEMLNAASHVMPFYAFFI